MFVIPCRCSVDAVVSMMKYITSTAKKAPTPTVVAEVKRLTNGGADVSIEALGIQETFEKALRCLRPGGTLSSLGVYSGKLQMPYDAFAAGLGDYKIVTTLLPGR